MEEEHEKFALVIKQMRKALRVELDLEHANPPTSSMQAIWKTFLFYFKKEKSSKQTAEIKRILDDLKDLGNKWKRIKANLADADGRGIPPSDLNNQQWLRDLRMLTYKAQHLHDLCQYQLTACQIQPQESSAVADGSNLATQMAVCPSPMWNHSFWEGIADHIREFNKSYSEVKESIHLIRDLVVNKKKTESVFNPIPTGSLPPCESQLFGRHKDLDQLVDLLKKEDSKAVQVIAIVGMGGVGKTTLAQHIYQALNDSKYFDLRGWVFVYETYDIVGLTRAALNSFTKEEFRGTELDPLQSRLSELVKGEKIFLVMDDMWNQVLQIWESFLAPFRQARTGSKILITTREERVSQTSGATDIVKLGCLAEDDAWSLFRQYAFQHPQVKYPQELVDIGKEIIRKCGYLPLAVKLLASSMRNEDHDKWGHFLDSNILNLDEQSGNQILGALYFSYRKLPERLKNCFRICHLFRKGEMIDRKELAELWISHNLIAGDHRGKLYEKADDYISQLDSRSFFEIKWFGDRVRIHDLLYDLLEYISEENHHIPTDVSKNQELRIPDHVRHARMVLDDDGNWSISKAISLQTLWVKNETSLIVFPSIQIAGLTSLRILYIAGELSQNTRVRNLDDCLQQSKLLHAFTYRDQMEMMPDSLFTLYNLRRLDFSGSKMLTYLPDSIVKLKNLKQLDLSGTGITELPRGITSLTKLQSLNLKDTDILFMPSGISCLTELRYLPYFPIGNVDVGHAGLGELNKLQHLSDELAICNLEDVKTEEAKECGMNVKHGLLKLKVNWMVNWKRNHGSYDWAQFRTPESDEAVLEELKPHTNIRELAIDGYAGKNLPSWIEIVRRDGSSFFRNLKKVTLAHCLGCRSISSIQKLKCLDELHIRNMWSLIEIVSTEGSSSFQTLKILKIMDCSQLESIPLHKLPALVQLHVEECAKLQNIDFVGQSENPQSILSASIEEVVIKQCDWLWFPSHASLPQLLKLFKVERCLMMSHWVRCNRTSKLGHVAHVYIDNCNIISNTTEMEMMSLCSIADQMREALHSRKKKKSLVDMGISKRKEMMVTDVGISKGKGKMVTDVGDPKGKKVLEDTGDTASMDVRLLNKILEELEYVDCKSPLIKGMLDDAEERSGSLDVESLHYLRSLAYMVEDLHDLFEYQHNAIRVESNSADQVNHSLADPRFWEDIENRIKEFKQLFGFIAKEDTCLDKKEGFQKEIVNSLVTNVSSLPPFEFIGRKEQYFDILVELLLMDQGNEVVEVIAIGGKAGVGKTAFAQLIFQHLKQLNHFDAMGWVYVSEHFDAEDILIAAERSFKKFFNRGGKKSFLVLDNIQYLHIWEVFLGLFISRYEGMGSKILITTREPSVPGWQGVANHMELPCLDEEEGWSLFERHAYSGVPDEEKPPGLIEIGKQIVKKCGYLPLSLKVLGCSFRYERCDEDTWRRVLEESSGDQWDLVQLEGGSREKILGPLYFCYLRLPSHLKACLRFCCLFHRGESIGRKDLIELWMAHNLIRISTDNEGTLQYRKGEEWIEELVSRAFLEIPRCTDDDSGIVLIPDLVYYILLRHASGGEFQTIDGNIGVLKLLPHHRHVRGFRTRLEQMDINNLRTVWIEKYPRELEYSSYFQSLAVSSGSSLRVLTIDGVEPTILDVWLAKAKLLRVLNISDRFGSRIWLPQSLFELYNLIHLNLSGYQIEELPESISNLKNLRHLDLSNTGLERMPWSLFELYNLIHLNLSGNKIGFLTKSIGNLKNLRHLDLSNTGLTSMPDSLFERYNLIHLNLSGNDIEKLPESIGNLKNLRHLDLSDMGLKRMPDAIVKLTNLRSFYIKGNDRLAFTPRGLFRLKGFEVLDSFVAPLLTIEGEQGLQELGDLERDHPIHSLIFEINGLQNVNKGDAIKDDILLNVHCHDLSLYWDAMYFFSHSSPRGEPEQEVVLNKLRPHSCIKQLRMERYKGCNLPAWMGDKSLVNLVSVTLVLLEECTSISCLGELPSLEKLYIMQMYWLREVASVVQSSSGSASTCHHILSFPKLTDLVIKYCRKITRIPLYRFPALTDLYISNCPSLEIVEFSGSLECPPEFGYTSSIGQIEIRECKEVQFRSEMAVLTSLRMLHIYDCEKLSAWVESNRSTLLKDVPEIKIGRPTF